MQKMNILTVVHIPKQSIDDFFEIYQQVYEDANPKQKYLIRLPNPDLKWGGLTPVEESVNDQEWWKINLWHLSDFPIVRITLEAILSQLRTERNYESKLETVQDIQVTLPVSNRHTTLESFHYRPNERPSVETNYYDSPFLKTYRIGFRLQFPADLLDSFYSADPLALQFTPVGIIPPSDETDEHILVEYITNQHPRLTRTLQRILFTLLENTVDTVAILTIFLEDRTILDCRMYEFEDCSLNFISSYTYVPALDAPLRVE